MSEALKFKLKPKLLETSFDDGDGGGFVPTIHELTVSVLDNGYVLSVILDDITDFDINDQPIPDMISEVYTTNETLLKRISEILKA